MPSILTTERYERSLAKFKKLHPEMREKYIKTLRLLGENPYHPALRLHKMKGKFEEYYSVSLNMKYRMMLDFIIKDDQVILINIGGHELYE
ncbi:MAG: mRNA-degrading endonuclease YafQ of YafQ-DinJ toxin-antitoxin module [Saprospiraceae bacterium]|jgi:mRNA-degrading endonuclease YafQ of YafQ-DinJ toxin-antitoxin module|tara:strand:+ start:816 stop:1088 length:273 start_codon:yes stop_codon:yes gene_type:complete